MTDAHDPQTGEVYGDTSFSTLLIQMDAGKFHGEASASLSDLMKKLKDHLLDTGDKTAVGSITVSFRLTADALGYVEIVPQITVKEPKAKEQRRIMFMTPSGTLTAKNPNQPDLPFRTIGGSAAQG